MKRTRFFLTGVAFAFALAGAMATNLSSTQFVGAYGKSMTGLCTLGTLLESGCTVTFGGIQCTVYLHSTGEIVPAFNSQLSPVVCAQALRRN